MSRTPEMVNRPKEKDLPKFITIDAHDGEGNSRPVKYINEDAIELFSMRVRSALAKLDRYALMGDDDK